MQSRFKLGLMGLTVALILGAAQSAQAFTMVVDEYNAYLIQTTGRWVSGTSYDPVTGDTWTYYYNLVSTDGYAGGDGVWYYVMTFENAEQLDYTYPNGTTVYYGPSGIVQEEPGAGDPHDPHGSGGSGGGINLLGVEGEVF